MKTNSHLQNSIEKFFNTEINTILKPLDKKINVKLTITDNKKDTLIHLLIIIINKIKLDNKKGAVFKARLYTDAIKIIQSYPHESIIDSKHLREHFRLKGKKKFTKLLVKIDEFIDTGTIEEAERYKVMPEVKSLMELTKIYAIGPAKAKELYLKHYIITIDELRKKVRIDSTIINNKQKIGLVHYTDLAKRIPRSEIIEYERELLSIAVKLNKNIILSINGSYRRGLDTSGDIDILITSNEGDTSVIRQKFIEELKTQGIIIETLASGKKKFMGLSKLSKYNYNIVRHLDIIDTRSTEFPFAQLYFTGSGGFNSYMRGIALSKGYSLNEYCLSHKKTKIPVNAKEISDKLHKSLFETEEDIFRFLDMEYVSPCDRQKSTLNKY